MSLMTQKSIPRNNSQRFALLYVSFIFNVGIYVEGGSNVTGIPLESKSNPNIGKKSLLKCACIYFNNETL